MFKLGRWMWLTKAFKYTFYTTHTQPKWTIPLFLLEARLPQKQIVTQPDLVTFHFMEMSYIILWLWAQFDSEMYPLTRQIVILHFTKNQRCTACTFLCTISFSSLVYNTSRVALIYIFRARPPCGAAMIMTTLWNEHQGPFQQTMQTQDHGSLPIGYLKAPLMTVMK